MRRGDVVSHWTQDKEDTDREGPSACELTGRRAHGTPAEGNVQSTYKLRYPFTVYISLVNYVFCTFNERNVFLPIYMNSKREKRYREQKKKK